MQENENITQQEMDDGSHKIQEVQAALKEDDEMMNELHVSLQNMIQNMEAIASEC